MGYLSSAFNGADHFVVFAVVGFSPPAGVYYSRVSPGGMLLDGPPDQLGASLSGPPAAASRLVYPAIASNGSLSLVVWVDNTELSGTSKDVIGVFVARF